MAHLSSKRKALIFVLIVAFTLVAASAFAAQEGEAGNPFVGTFWSLVPPIIAIASPPASDFGTCRSNASALTNVLTAADIIAPTSMNGIVCNMSPAAPVPMRTSGIGRPRD